VVTVAHRVRRQPPATVVRSSIQLLRPLANARVAVCQANRVHQVRMVNPESPENQEHPALLAPLEKHQNQHVTFQPHHRASRARLVHLAHQDLLAMLAIPDHQEHPEDRDLTLHQANQVRRVHQVHPVSLAATVRPVNPAHQQSTNHSNPEIQDHPETLDLKAHQVLLDHLVRTVYQDHKDQRVRRDHLENLARTVCQANPVHQENLALRGRRVFAPSTARWTAVSSSRMAQEDKRSIFPFNGESLIADTKNDCCFGLASIVCSTMAVAYYLH